MQPKPTFEKPPCANWKLWVGEEVEGTTSIGTRTLFIRSLEEFPDLVAGSNLSALRTFSKASRVWFCKEFRNWELLMGIMTHFDEVCVEVLAHQISSLPARIRKRATLYVKLDVDLKAGDFVCVGPAFADEAFKIGTGAKVTPDLYRKDIEIKR